MSSAPPPYLLEISGVLWPADRRRSGVPAQSRRLRAVPSARTPSLLLPEGRAAAAAAVRAYGGHGTTANRLRTRATAALFSLGLAPLAFRDTVTVDDGPDSIAAELSRILGRSVQVALRGGPARANRKPVLAVLDDDGALLAFAKVGTTPLVQELLHTEAGALQRLAPLLTGAVHAPQLLHFGEWRGMSVLVQEALPVRRPQSPGRRELISAVAELARCVGSSVAPWGASEHAELVRDRLASSPEILGIPELREGVAALDVAELPLALGAWHGDLTPWNCASGRDAVLIWDWERFSTGAPVGFDVLHYVLQAAVARARRPAADLPRALLADAAVHLAPLGVGPEAAQLTALAYLIEIATRYLVDDQAGSGARAGNVGSWLLPVIGEAAAAHGATLAASDRGVRNV